MNAFARFFLLLTAFGLLPLGGALAWFSRSNAVVRENARAFHSQLADLAAESVEAAAAQMNRSLGFALELGEGRLSAEREAAVLQRAVVEGSWLMAELRAPDGRRLLGFSDARARPALEDDEAAWAPLTAEALSSGKVALGAARAGAVLFVPVVYPLADGRLLRAAYGLEGLRRRLAGLSGGRGGRVVLADARGALLPGFSGATLPAAAGRGWREDVSSASGPGAPAAGPGGPAAGPLVGAWTEVPALGWAAWSLQPRAEAFALGERAGERAAALFAVWALLVGAASLWVSRRIASPLRSLAEGARLSGAGRFDAPVPETGWGEFREVARAFNAMLRGLEAYRLMQVDRQLEDKARLESLMRTVPAGIVLAEGSGRVLYINSWARQALEESGVTDSGGSPDRQALRDPRLRELIAAALAQRRRLSHAELALERAGKPCVFFCQARAVESQGRVLGALLVVQDVTAERQLAALRERFLNAIVHDLRAPITAVSGWAQFMDMQDAPSPVWRKASPAISSSVKNMTELVDNILDTAKLKAGGVRPLLAPVCVGELLEEVRALFALRAEMRGLTLGVEAPGAAALVCDRRLMARALGNLVGNALKFTPEGGSVFLRAAAVPGGMELSVRDTGRGIPADKLAGVFRPFEQVGAEDAALGFGLGLSLVKEWVELHGGGVRVESEPGKGTRFTLSLPGRREAAAAGSAR